MYEYVHVYVCMSVCETLFGSMQSSVTQSAAPLVGTALAVACAGVMMAGEDGSAMSAYQQWDAVSTQYTVHPASNIHYTI